MGRIEKLLLVLFLLLSSSAYAVESESISGIKPAQRPVNAPVITSVTHNAEWYQQWLHGVDKPYPASLQFLESQGNWYSPFGHPGLSGPYDIRGWYK